MSSAAYREAHREELAAKTRAWAAANRERKRAADRARYEADPAPARERARRWYEENPERARETARKYAEEHASELADYKRQWQIAHADEMREYRIANRQRRASRQAERRARLRGALVEPVDRLTLFELHGGICGICQTPVDRRDFHVDHIVPLSRGGEHSYANTQPTHPACNLRKHSGYAAEHARGALVAA